MKDKAISAKQRAVREAKNRVIALETKLKIAKQTYMRLQLELQKMMKQKGV